MIALRWIRFGFSVADGQVNSRPSGSTSAQGGTSVDIPASARLRLNTLKTESLAARIGVRRLWLMLLLVAACVASLPVLAAGLECPSLLAARIVAHKYPGWTVYSDNPLRLSGADVAYPLQNEIAWLDPDQVEHLSDEYLSTAYIYRLTEHPEAGSPVLVCHYGEHAQLSRSLPTGTAECRAVRHQRFGPTEPEFAVSCK